MSHGHHGPPKEPIGWMDRPEAVKLFFRVFYVLCGLMIVGELIFGKETAHPHPYEGPMFFYAIYGFVSFWFLVLVARPMRSLLIRAEDYYETGGAYVEDAAAEHGHEGGDDEEDADG